MKTLNSGKNIFPKEKYHSFALIILL